jgi:uracil-DNA glycosylase family 4
MRDLDELNQEVRACRKCELWKTREKAVPGEGSANADLIFIGEAPGFNEDQQGKPFVGKAGKVLDELLEWMGLMRREIYITNVLKCRPPGNSNPTVEQIKACSGYLDRQLSLIQPRLIIPMGKFAAQHILEKFNLEPEKISVIHGRVYTVNTLEGTKTIIPVYHPAVATYNPDMMDVLLEDFKTIKNDIGLRKIG